MTIPRASGVVASHGEDIYYEVTGASGDVVVLCHGLGGNHAVWFQQVPAFAEDFRVVTWDQRGFGMSTNRKKDAGPAAAVDDLVTLLDHIGADRAHLVGQSMGGWAVVGFALAHPERVASLVIADSVGGIMNDVVVEILTVSPRRTVPEGVLGSHPAVSPELDATKAYLYQQIGSFKGDLDDADMIGKLFSTRHDAATAGQLRMPVLCVVGAADDRMPPAAIREVASLIPGATVTEIEAAGHSPYFEKPDEWNAAVLGFLRDLSGD